MKKLIQIKKCIPLFLTLFIFSVALQCYDDNFENAIKEENSFAPFADYPAPGNGGIITVSNITASTLILHWTRATDDSTAQSDLEYRVFRSLSNNIASFTDAVANGTELTSDWTLDFVNFYDNGLANGTTYYYSVFVRDEDNNISAYIITSAHTTGGTVYLFPAGPVEGDLNGRSGADSLCQAAFTKQYASLPVATVKAFISISASDQISDIPSNYGLPTDLAIQYPSTVNAATVVTPTLASDWSDLLDGTISFDLKSALGIVDDWWSGSDSSGNFIDVKKNCNGFTDNSNSFDGMTGDKNVTDSAWISNKAENCNVKREVLCIAW